MNTENANISEDLSSRFAEDLPLNFRSVISLTLINSSVNNAAEEQIVGAPGLSQTADQDISFLNFGGTFFDTAEYLMDGTWDTRADWGGVIYVPSVDDVQEMKILTNAFTAQYGWSSGNVVNIVTKSGTNEIHGDAWEFYANSSCGREILFQQWRSTGVPSQSVWRHDRRPNSAETNCFSLPTMKAAASITIDNSIHAAYHRGERAETSRRCWGTRWD